MHRPRLTLPDAPRGGNPRWLKALVRLPRPARQSGGRVRPWRTPNRIYRWSACWCRWSGAGASSWRAWPPAWSARLCSRCCCPSGTLPKRRSPRTRARAALHSRPVWPGLPANSAFRWRGCGRGFPRNFLWACCRAAPSWV